jgi:S1-C subfamily serine protease
MRINKLNILFGLFLSALVSPQNGSGSESRDIRRDSTVEAVEKVLPSVVNIATETMVQVQDPFEELFNPFFGPYHRKREPNSQLSLGSGVVIDEEGYVLTNDHVVRRADKIWVKINGRDEPYAAKLVASNTKSDIALLKLDAKEGERFKAVQFAADDDLLLGETVLAMGNPFGLGGSVSRGILSSKSRMAPKENNALDIPNWLQTDASINPGNSGGPLVNLRGELIGINVAILTQGQGIGFAIPIKFVNSALTEIITPELSGKALWFGAKIRASTMPLTVASVQSGSPASAAGLKTGDSIISINGNSPKGLIDFNQKLVNAKSKVVAMQVNSGGETRDVMVRMIPEKNFFNTELIKKRLGIGLEDKGGAFLIQEVSDDSPAANVLQPGWFVTGIESQPASDMIAAAKQIYAKNPGDKVRLDLVIQVERGALRFQRSAMVEIPVK